MRKDDTSSGGKASEVIAFVVSAAHVPDSNQEKGLFVVAVSSSDTQIPRALSAKCR